MKVLSLGFALVAFTFLAQPAVARDDPLRNPADIPIPWNKADPPALETLQRAIISGCTVRGWVCKAEAPGVVRAVLMVRKHRAESRITFDTQKYSVTYVDSSELRYDPVKDEIHRKYNLWIANLIGDINRSIASIP